MPVPIVGSSDDLSTGPESVGHILGRLAYEYGQTLERKEAAPHKAERLAIMALGAVLMVQVIAAVMVSPLIPEWPAHDFVLYRDAAARWLATGEFYSGYQLAGPYVVVADEILYPPVALLLFAPFTVLPAILWLLIPVGIVAWVVWSQKPSLRQWAVILFLVTFPVIRPVSFVLDMAILGNPTIWVAAFVALATRYPVFGPFALLKPVPALLPFALVGVRSRAWWIGLAIVASLSLAFLPMWFDYLTVLRNAQGGGVLYSLASLPVVLIPLVACASRSDLAWVRRRNDERASSIGRPAGRPRPTMAPRPDDDLRRVHPA